MLIPGTPENPLSSQVFDETLLSPNTNGEDLMKFLPVLAGAILAALPLTQPAAAQGGLTCAQLDEAEYELTDLLNTLEAQGIVQANSSFDQRLGIAADTAIQFALAEGDNRLISLAQGMRDGWEFKNIDQYLFNGDGMIEIYNRLYNRDC